MELVSGELSEIDISLKPYTFGDVNIKSFSAPGAVYQGALYVGESPLTLRLPVGIVDYIELDVSDKQKGAGVFFTPEFPDEALSITMRTAKPPEKGRVDKARRMYYWAWGSTWITGIAAWLTYQTFTSSDSAISYIYNQTGEYNQNFYDNNMRLYGVSIGSIVALGLAVALDVFFASRYINSANEGAASILGSGGN
jgi:hypothetical protein